MESLHEEWRPVVGFDGKYEVSSQGRVKALPCEHRHWCGRLIPQPERIITQSRHSGGYRIANLRGSKHYVHRLVMAAFVGPAPEGADVNHINGDKSDNRLGNLEYCDRLHNVRHAIATGLQDNSGESNGMNRYTEAQIRHAYDLVRRGRTYEAAAAESGVGVGTVESVAAGLRWTHLHLPPIRRRQTA